MITVAFTRPRERIPEAETMISALGMTPVGAPSLDVEHGRPRDYATAEELLGTGRAAFTVFGSMTAVEECRKEFGDRLVPLLAHTQVICTGPSTAAYLAEKLGRQADLVPAVYSSECVAREIAGRAAGKDVLLLRSDAGEREIIDILQGAGAVVYDVPAYRLIPAGMTPELARIIETLGAGRLDAALFTSPLSAAEFVGHMRQGLGATRADAALAKVFKVAIGKPTAAALKRVHQEADALPDESTFASMLAAVKAHFGQ